MQAQKSTTQQFNKIIEFRQTIYQYSFSQEADTQLELLDALTSSGPIRAFPELSFSQFFRRQWESVYTAVERGQQEREWLTGYLSQQLQPSCDEVVLMALDLSAWARPDAPTLSERQYIHSSTQDVTGQDVVVGQPYSLLAWVAQPGQSWTLPVRVQRVSRDQTEVEAGAAPEARSPLCLQGT
jgi:hypothetical protein